MDANFEVIIVGAGPAAWSAATFLARASVKTLVIGNPAHSGLADAAEVWNYPGFSAGISGRELLEQMQAGAVKQGAVFVSGEVTHIQKHSDILKNVRMLGGGFLIRTAQREEFTADRLLLAHGANFIKVDLPGEAELVGNGVHYCALCDGPLYKEKEVVVLGNGNFAAEEALQLAGMGVRVGSIITHAIAANIAPEYQHLLAARHINILVGRVEKFEPGIVLAVRGGDGAMRSHSTSAAFVALGVASSMTFAQKLGLDMNGNFLRADENGRTNVDGVWVAGLARGGVNQVGKSVGEGTIAAVDIIKAVKGLPQYLDHS